MVADVMPHVVLPSCENSTDADGTLTFRIWFAVNVTGATRVVYGSDAI